MEQIKVFTGQPYISYQEANKWLKEMAGQIVIKDRIFDTSSQQLMIFYEEVLKTEVRFQKFCGDDHITSWLQKMQTNGKYFRLLRTHQCSASVGGYETVIHRDIYYEVEVEAEDPQKK